MGRNKCTICGYNFTNTEEEISGNLGSPGNLIEDIQEDLICPLCGTDPELADENICPSCNTTFIEMPEDSLCPICDFSLEEIFDECICHECGTVFVESPDGFMCPVCGAKALAIF